MTEKADNPIADHGLSVRWVEWSVAENAPQGSGPDHERAARAAIIRHRVRRGGEWHQNSRAGALLFSDGTGMALSYREWGALSAEAWSPVDGVTHGYMDFYMDCRVTPAAGDAFGSERLHQLLTAITNQEVLAPATFAVADWDQELSRRDAKSFDSQWTRVNAEIKARSATPPMADADNAAIKTIREQAFLRAYEHTQSGEVAGEVSDDFGLIAAGLYLGDGDPWLNALWHEYRNQRFPRGKLEKIVGWLDF